MKSPSPRPPFLVFPDREGGFLVFEDPWEVFEGPGLGAAEALARTRRGWVAGGLEYARAEGPAPGWWGVFSGPREADAGDLASWATPGPVVVGPPRSPVSFDDYLGSFETVRSALLSGTTYQVNLTFPLVGTSVSGDDWAWPSALRLWLDLAAAQGREASFAVLGTPDRPGPVLVSASPELFFVQDGTSVEGRPMKGTAARFADPSQDAVSRHELATGPKTRAENLMVTDMLRNDLGRLAARGGVSVPRLFEVEEYPTVWQMTSTVRARFDTEPRLIDLVSALFPCASITGAPKLSTQDIIARAEVHPRGWYTGTLGWHHPGSPTWGPARSRFSVLIRTLVFDHPNQGEFVLGVGGGVVWDSTAPGEWDEAWAKARFLTPCRRTFSLTEAILWTNDGGPALLGEHEARLRAACRDFGGDLAPGALAQVVDDEVRRLVSMGRSAPFKLRVLVDPDFAVKAEGSELDAQPEVLTCRLAREPFGPGTLLWRKYKTTHRVIYDSHKVPGVDQTIHFNERGELTESTSMNLVLDQDGRLVTPALSSGLLGGTFRAQLLAEGKVEEAVLPTSALAAADRIWLVNSVRGWKAARLV